MKGKVIDLSCAKCGSNRLRFPLADEDPVTCEDCGAVGKSLREVKALMAGGKAAKADTRAERRDRHFSEVESSQKGIRASVAETDRLVGEADKMLRRHHQECEDEDGG